MEAYNPNGGMTPERRAFMEQAMKEQKEKQEWADKVAAQLSSRPGMMTANVPLMGLNENATVVQEVPNTPAAPPQQVQPVIPQIQTPPQEQSPAAMQEASAQAATTTPPPALQFPNNNDLAMRAATLKPMGDTERAFASQIVADKQAYDAAKAAGDEEGMARAHAHAEGLRRAASAYGVDMYAFDRQFSKDNTLENAQAYTQMDYDKGVGDISNMLTPQEHYYKVLAEYKAQGMRDRPAREKALEEMERYEAEYQRKLGTAMTRYGVNDDGSMNRFGAQIADLIYLNNPQSLALYDRYYANPFQNWKFNKNMQVQDKLYNQKVDYGQHQFDWQSALIRNKGDVEKTLIEAKNAGALALQNNKLAFMAAHPELTGGGRRGSSSEKPDKAESQLAMSLRNKTEQARQAIETSNPDREKSGDLLDDAIASNQKAYDEGKITEDVYSDFYGRLDALRRERDRAFGFKNT